MMKQFEVENLTNALTDIIIPKFDKYFEDRRNDISLQERINAIVDKIDDYEVLVNDLVEELGPDYKESITIGGYWFTFDEELSTYVYNENKLNNAKREVWNKEGLGYDHTRERSIITRIRAIITTLDMTAFDEVLKIVESQIDYNEFIVKQ